MAYDPHEQVPKESESKIVGLYARVSTGKQSTYGYSLDEQIKLGRERCAQLGWHLRYVFRECGESADTINRPKFKVMLEKAQQGCFNTLMFWKLDRCFRSLLDVINIEKQLREFDVQLYSLTEQIDTTTSFGRFNFRNLASAAEWERDMTKERTRLGMQALATQHKWPNPHPPLGYKIGKNQYLIIDAKEAKIVRYIYKKYLEIRSMPQLAYILNKRGVKPKRNGAWTATAVKVILTNRLYAGHYSIAGVEAEVPEYRIISKKTFDRVQEVRHRHIISREPMPMDRKKAKVEKMIGQYLERIREEEPFYGIEERMDPG